MQKCFCLKIKMIFRFILNMKGVFSPLILELIGIESNFCAYNFILAKLKTKSNNCFL